MSEYTLQDVWDFLYGTHAKKELLRAISAAKTSEAELRAQLANVQNTAIELRAENERLMEERDAMSMANSSLHGQLDKAEQQIAELEQEKKRLLDSNHSATASWLDEKGRREKAEQRIAKLEAATKYAERLVRWLQVNHYPEVARFEPLTGDLMGLLSQIDNMICGFPKRASTKVWIAAKAQGLTDECAAFAAQEAAGAQGVPDVDWLSNVIRSVDGEHKLGAGALAEKIVEALKAAAPSAPAMVVSADTSVCPNCQGTSFSSCNSGIAICAQCKHEWLWGMTCSRSGG